MARTVRVHIGPMKSGSTTVQGMFAADRVRMATHGFLYPDGPRGQTNHSEAVLDFLRHSRSPMPPMGPFEVVMVQHRPARRRGAWRRLRQAVADHPGDAVISSEFLALFSADVASEFVDDLAADDVEVVMVKRLPSQLVPSWYQERIKRMAQPAFAQFAATVVADLALPEPSEFDFIGGSRLANRWRSAGASVRVIDASAGLSDEVIEATAGAATPGLRWQAPSAPANASMSAVGTRLWRQHMETHAGAYVGALHAVRERMLHTFPATSTGPKLRMNDEAAAALDNYCDGRIDSLPEFGSWVQPMPEVPFDSRSALRQMADWQAAAERKWQVLDVGSRIIGRGPLIRSLR